MSDIDTELKEIDGLYQATQSAVGQTFDKALVEWRRRSYEAWPRLLTIVSELQRQNSGLREVLALASTERETLESHVSELRASSTTHPNWAAAAPGRCVEDALRELREMFPGSCPYFTAQDYTAINGSIEVRIFAGGVDAGKGKTLAEAMRKVRERKRSKASEPKLQRP